MNEILYSDKIEILYSDKKMQKQWKIPKLAYPMNE